MPHEPLTDDDLAAVARALAHPARVRIVRLLAAQSECRGADVFAELPLAQSTVSEHLRILADAGIVSARRVGTASVYCLHVERLEGLSGLAQDLIALAPSCSTQGAC